MGSATAVLAAVRLITEMLRKNNSDARPRAKTCLKWVRDEQRFWIFEHFCKIRMEN